MKEYRIAIDDEEALGTLAETLSRAASPRDTLLLFGGLGAGKTSFARRFIRAQARQAVEVVSPTFLLVQEYPSAAGHTVFHYDLYRLDKPEELWELGLEEVLGNALVLVEWPDAVAYDWPEDRLEIRLSLVEGDPHKRLVVVTSYGNMVGKMDKIRIFE